MVSATLYEKLEPKDVAIDDLFLVKDPHLSQGLRPTKVFKLHKWGFTVVSTEGSYMGNVHFDEPSRGILVKPEEGGLDRLLVGTTTSEDIELFDSVRNRRYGKYAHHDDPRTNFMPEFESGFPLIYVGDTVKVSDSWADHNSTNPHLYKKSEVIKIYHGFQSLFNRDYINVRIAGNDGEFETWLYTLNLIERVPRNVQALREGKLIYLNDRVEVLERQNPRFGRSANVRGVSIHNKQLEYNLADEIIMDEVLEVEADIERERKIPDSGQYYTKRKKIMEEAIRALRSQTEFTLDANSVRLLEVYPPNKLFRAK